jgi:hypothetical protein
VPAFSSSAFSTTAFSSNAFDLDSTASSGFVVDDIVNENAVDGVGYYEICQRTGHKMLPIWHPHSQFTVDGYGDYVRKKSVDPKHPQDDIGSRGNDYQAGPQNPEDNDDDFIAVSVSPSEDL